MMTTITTLGAIFMTPLLCKLLLGTVVPVDAVGIAFSTIQVCSPSRGLQGKLYRDAGGVEVLSAVLASRAASSTRKCGLERLRGVPGHHGGGRALPARLARQDV